MCYMQYAVRILASDWLEHCFQCIVYLARISQSTLYKYNTLWKADICDYPVVFI